MIPKGILISAITLCIFCLISKSELNNIFNKREYRFEPFELHSRRMNFNLNNIKNYPQSLIDIKYRDDLNKLICIASQDISANDSIIEFEERDLISSSHPFPLKSKFINILSEDDYLHNNITKKLLLSFHLMFEIKSNMTLAFLSLGRSNNAEQYLDEFRDYLRKRKGKHILVNYIHNIPLSSRLSHSTWSSDLLSEYHLSGTVSPSTEKLKGFYKGFILQVKNDTLLSQAYSHWLNDNEINYFLSIYSFVSSKAIMINGDYYLVPFLDVCSHYHPNSNEDNKPKGIKGMSIDTERGVKYQIISQGFYAKGNEFSFTYTDDLSNDNLLLNYGLIISKNIFHSYLFQVDLIDPKYNFYKYLLKNNFNMNLVKLSSENDDKLSSTFSLSLSSLNEELFKFIHHYLEYTSPIDKDKSSASKKALDDSIHYRSLQSYLVYYSTIHKNILSVTDKMPNQTISSYIEALSKDLDSIEYHQSRVNSMNNNTIQENFENLFIYNQLHSLLNKRNINVFNLENIRLLINHQFYLYDDIKKLQIDSIKKLKANYVQ